jgi:hypothetical protein
MKKISKVKTNLNPQDSKVEPKENQDKKEVREADHGSEY